MKKKYLNIACLGAGKHAFKNTIPSLLDLSLFKLVGIYKRNIKNIEKRIVIPKCKISNDLNTILNIKNLDAVYISSTPNTHYNLSRRALLLNKHVIVEKPAVINLSQAKKLRFLANKRKLVIMEAFMYKHHHQFKVLLDFLNKIKDKKLKISSTFGFPHLDKLDFRYDIKSGGGALLDAGSYAISSIINLSKKKIFLNKADIIYNGYNVDLKGFAKFLSIDGSEFKANWYFGGKYKNQISIKYEKKTIIIDRAFSKPNNLTTKINFYENNRLIKSQKIKKDNHFKNMFIFFYKCCFNEHLRLNQSTELFKQAKFLNDISLMGKEH
jgi:dTDP-3,4-didehydro-2,6-dideoxy-alpha-D-glucose 3-reductase